MFTGEILSLVSYEGSSFLVLDMGLVVSMVFGLALSVHCCTQNLSNSIWLLVFSGEAKAFLYPSVLMFIFFEEVVHCSEKNVICSFKKYFFWVC